MRGVGNPSGVAGAEETWTQRSQNMRQGSMDLRMIVQRQVTPRWENDPVCLHKGSIRESG